MAGRLATPNLPPLPLDLAGWRWERQDHLLRLVYVATNWATPWRDDEAPEHSIGIACRYMRVMEIDTMTSTTPKKTTRRSADQSSTSDLPPLPENLTPLFRWEISRARASATGSLEPHYRLVGPGDWATNIYTKSEKAIAEAHRWLLSQPKPKVGSGKTTHHTDTDLDDELFMQLGAAGWKWEEARLCSNGWHHRLTSYKGGTVGGRRLTRARIVAELLPGDTAAIDWDELDAILARHDARHALWFYADQHEYSVSVLQDQAIQRALDEARRQIAAGYVDDATMIADRFGDLDLRAEACMEIEKLLPPGGSAEATLTSHGWTWHAEESRGQPGYLFHNRATYETCWYVSLDARLQADARHADLYRFIEAGWSAPVLGDHNARYTRPPGVSEQQAIATTLIHRGRYQPRHTFSDEELQGLANSVAEHGILTRLKVFVNERGEYELIAGERRLRAAKLTGLDQVPVEICEYTLAQIHEISIIDNLQREGLTPVEEGIAYERLATELNISESELSRRLGKNRAYIQQRRAIGRAAPEVQAALTDGTLTFSQVRGLCLGSADNHKVQMATLKKLREQLKEGRRIGEKDAQREAEKAALRAVKKDLEGLDWKVAEGGNAPQGSGVWLWSDGERPRSYTSNELLSIAHERRRPGGVAPKAYTLSNVDEAALDIKDYYHYKSFAPWIVLSGSGADIRALDATELPALFTQIYADFAAMQARYQAAGWELRHDDGHSFHATSREQRTERPWLWKGVEELITKIEAGQISSKPDPKQQQQSTLVTWECVRCMTTHTTYSYTYQDNKKYCQPCIDVLNAERAAQVDAQARALASHWQASLEHLDLDLLQLMTMRMADGNRGKTIGASTWAKSDEIAKVVLAWDRSTLIEMFTRLVATYELECWPSWQPAQEQEAAA